MTGIRPSVLGSFLCLASLALPVLAQDSARAKDPVPTAYVGDDIAGLDQALAKDPANFGLRMRIVRRLLEDWRTSADPKVQTDCLARVERELQEIKRQGPDFTYPYRVLALQHYRRGEWEKFLEIAREHEKIAPLDFDLRTFYVKSLLRIATNPDKPDPARKKEAAEYVGNWFDGGEAPAFGATVGTCAAWLYDEGFRDELLAIFEERYRRDPKNINLVISYAACLSNLGRNETAWNLVHAAEPWGLADQQTGGRHPIVRLLQMDCPESKTETSFDGHQTDRLEELAKKYPQDASLCFRLASQLKIKGLAAETVVGYIDRRLAAIAKKEATGDVAKLEADRKEWEKKSKDFYAKAIEPALTAWNINPTIESVSLLLGECYAKIGRNDDAVKHLKEAIEKVPFYFGLRERLAQIYKNDGRWKDLALEMVEVCKVVAVRADNWEHDVKGSLLPVPRAEREIFIRDLLENKEAAKALISTFEEAAMANTKNPNLKTFLAMMYYFAGQKAKACEWMLAAEKQGICGDGGRQNSLATEIFSRERW